MKVITKLPRMTTSNNLRRFINGLNSRLLVTSTKRDLPQSESQANPLIVIEQDSNHEHFKVLKMNRPPVNSLNLEMFQALIKGVDELEKTKSLEGAIIHTTSPSVFCAGLDLSELHNPTFYRFTLIECKLEV